MDQEEQNRYRTIKRALGITLMVTGCAVLTGFLVAIVNGPMSMEATTIGVITTASGIICSALGARIALTPKPRAWHYTSFEETTAQDPEASVPSPSTQEELDANSLEAFQGSAPSCSSLSAPALTPILPPLAPTNTPPLVERSSPSILPPIPKGPPNSGVGHALRRNESNSSFGTPSGMGIFTLSTSFGGALAQSHELMPGSAFDGKKMDTERAQDDGVASTEFPSSRG